MTFLPQTLPLVLLALLLASPAMGVEEEEEEPTPVDEDSKILAPLLPESKKPLSAAAPWAMTKASCSDQLGVLPDLRSRAKQLDGREQVLDARETAVELLEVRAGEQITRLESIRAEILEAMATQVARRDSRVEELAKMMGTMKAKKAAPLLATSSARRPEPAWPLAEPASEPRRGAISLPKPRRRAPGGAAEKSCVGTAVSCRLVSSAMTEHAIVPPQTAPRTRSARLTMESAASEAASMTA
jgi:flagellar motility protein MotE (MotC chaperone)